MKDVMAFLARHLSLPTNLDMTKQKGDLMEVKGVAKDGALILE